MNSTGMLAKSINASTASLRLPRLGSRPSSLLDLKQWHDSSEVEKSLKRVFENPAAYHQYIVITEKITLLLALLLAKESLYVKNADLDEAVLFDRLRKLAIDRENHQTKSDFVERFRFFKSAKERKQCLKQLEKWNSRLRNLSEMILPWTHRKHGSATALCRAVDAPWNSLLLSINDPTAHIRLLTRELYEVLSKCWKCSCTNVHEAKFCLNLHGTEKVFADVDAQFDFLVSSTSLDRRQLCWKEGTVGVRSVSSPLAATTTQLRKVCEAVEACMAAFRLRLLMEDVRGQQCLWKLDPRPRRFAILDSEPPISLHNLLTGNAKMGPYKKRELAVICAYSLLLLHDTPWFGSGWNKSNLTFFYNLNHEPDFARPFISARFESSAHQIGEIGSGVFHRNSHILALGILFIEIFNEKPIERWRNAQERASVSPETESMINLLVADRIVKKMDNSPSRAAIEACLDLDWVPQGKPVTLEDPEVREGLFRNIIQPLEAEIAMLT